MSEVIKQLSAGEREKLAQQTDAIAAAPVSTVDARSGQRFVFVAHFDGTNNDKDNLKLSGNPQPTNVAELWALMKPQESGHNSFRTQYYRGVGTDPGAKGVVDVLAPTAEMKATANQAYEEFKLHASDWLSAHPHANPAESLQIMATGFSRGGGTAAVFSQLLYERGLSDPQTGKTLVPPGQLGLAGAMIFDPVTTGYDGNSAFSPTSQNITVVQAQNEYRTLFKGVDHSGHPGVTVIPVTGNHCNIGSGYDRGIGAKVLESATDWFRRSGTPINDVPSSKRNDGSATVYHERNLPKSDTVAQASQHPLARATFPLGSRVVEGAAGAADYPVTHDPRDGLHARRELDPAAAHERQRADGWRRFNGVEGAVWRKDYVSDKGVPLSAVVVERNPPGAANDRVDFYLSRRDGKGELLYEKRLPAGEGPALRESLEQWMNPSARKRAAAIEPSSSDDPRRHAHSFKDQLGPRLTQLGMSEQQIDTLAAAAAKEATRHAGQGEVSEFLLKSDASAIALRQERAPVQDFSVSDALGQSAQAHWQEVAEMEHGLRTLAVGSAVAGSVVVASPEQGARAMG